MKQSEQVLLTRRGNRRIPRIRKETRYALHGDAKEGCSSRSHARGDGTGKMREATNPGLGTVASMRANKTVANLTGGGVHSTAAFLLESLN